MHGRIGHVGLITLEALAVLALYYLGDFPQFGGAGSTYAFLGSQAYHELCLLLFAPALIHAAIVFRIRGAIIVSLVFSAALLPHAFLFTPYPEPFFREVSFAAISLLLGGVIAGQLNGRERLEKEQARLRSYASQTLEVQEMERHYLAHELHDETAQALVDVSHKVDALLEESEVSGAGVGPDLRSLRTDVDAILEGTRRFIQHLRPPLLEELGLGPALRWLVEQAAEEACFDVCINIPTDTSTRLPAAVELTLFRIAQEAVTNARRHSQATRIELDLEYSKDEVTLRVADNGVGFSLFGHDELEKAGRFGLIGITERAHLAGGRAQVQSAPGKGTTVTVTLPVPTAEDGQ